MVDNNLDRRTHSPSDAFRAATIIVLSIFATILLYWVIPFGRTVAYPLILLSTLAHELGHGLAAICVGGHFERFVMYADGSGVAVTQGAASPFQRAIVLAGGLVGPAIGAAIGFVMGRTAKRSRVALFVIAFLLVLAMVMVVRNPFGFLFVGATAILCFLTAWKGKPWLSHVVLLFFSCQLALSVFSRSDYLFTDVAQTGNGPMPSDVAQMADALLLPYWFWGGLCGLLSVVILLVGLRISFRRID